MADEVFIMDPRAEPACARAVAMAFGDGGDLIDERGQQGASSAASFSDTTISMVPLRLWGS